MTTPAHYGLEPSDLDAIPAGAFPGDQWVKDDPRAPINARKPRHAVAAVTAAWGARPPAQKLVALAFALEDWGTDTPLSPGEAKLARWSGVHGRALEDAVRGLLDPHQRKTVTSPQLLRRKQSARKGVAFPKYRIIAPDAPLSATQATITGPRPAVELMNHLPPLAGVTYADRLILSMLAVLARDGTHAEVSKLELSRFCGLHRNAADHALGRHGMPGTLTAAHALPHLEHGGDPRPLVTVSTPPSHHKGSPAVWDLSPLYAWAAPKESHCG